MQKQATNFIIVTSQPVVKNYHNKHHGFTLLEVMVALAILAMVAVTASQASFAYVNSVERLREKTLAHFVAMNTAADMQMQGVWLTGSSSKMVEEQGRQWQVYSKAEATLSEDVKRITIEVAPITEGEVAHSLNQQDTLKSAVVTELIFFLCQPQ